MTAGGATVRSEAAPPVVQLEDLPAALRGLEMPDHDYHDVFTVLAPWAREERAEDWARVVMEGASPAGRFMAWRVACNLRLHRGPSPDHVAGWRIVERADDWIRVEASSWFMTAQGVLKVEDGALTFALFVRYERVAGVFLWPAIAVIHRRAVPGLLRGGVRRMNRRRG